jgi:hypothetical protein
VAAQQQQEQRHQQQQQQQHLHLPESRFSTWNSSPSQPSTAAAAAVLHHSLRTHASGNDGSTYSSGNGSSSFSGIRGHRSGSTHTWGGSSSSPGGSSSRQHAAAVVPRLSAQGQLAAAAAAAAGGGGGGGPTSPGGLLSPVMQLRFPSCRLEGAVVKMVRGCCCVCSSACTGPACPLTGRGWLATRSMYAARLPRWALAGCTCVLSVS